MTVISVSFSRLSSVSRPVGVVAAPGGVRLRLVKIEIVGVVLRLHNGVVHLRAGDAQPRLGVLIFLRRGLELRLPVHRFEDRDGIGHRGGRRFRRGGDSRLTLCLTAARCAQHQRREQQRRENALHRFVFHGIVLLCASAQLPTFTPFWGLPAIGMNTASIVCFSWTFLNVHSLTGPTCLPSTITSAVA